MANRTKYYFKANGKPARVYPPDREDPFVPPSEDQLTNLRLIVPEASECIHTCATPSEPLYGFLSPVGTTPAGQPAIKNQRILVVDTASLNTLLPPKKTDKQDPLITITFSRKATKPKNWFKRLINWFCRLFQRPLIAPGEIIRIGECPNDENTKLILVEWPASAGITDSDEVATITGPGSRTPVLPLKQLYNLVIKEDPAGVPGSPITGGGTSTIAKVYPSDLKKLTPELKQSYLKTYLANLEDPKALEMRVVAVLDTGLKFNVPPYADCDQKGHYKKASGDCTLFNVAVKAQTDCRLGNTLGYNAVSDYRKIVKMMDAREIIDTERYPYTIYAQVINEISAGLTEEDIAGTPFDDNLVDEIDEFGCCRQKVGRHGSIISAIINQKGAAVLPVKVFNAAGYGTFFDLLCGINYVFAQQGGGLPIKAVNASFTGDFEEGSRELNFLNDKFAQFKEKGIWVVAAAGNEDVDLATQKKYPACFEHDNIITVGTAAKPIKLVTGSGRIAENMPELTEAMCRAILTELGLESMADRVDWVWDEEWMTTNNFSSNYVAVAVAHADTDRFPSPFQNGDTTFTGTSIAAAYVSAAIVGLSRTYTTKKELLDAISTGGVSGLTAAISGGRLMTI